MNGIVSANVFSKNRVEELQGQVEEASEVGEKERQRADDLQAEKDKAEANSDMVRVFFTPS